jgi:hypothetical protein
MGYMLNEVIIMSITYYRKYVCALLLRGRCVCCGLVGWWREVCQEGDRGGYMSGREWVYSLHRLLTLLTFIDHAIAQAVSRWFLTTAVRVRVRVCSGGICGGQRGAGAGFLC